MRRQPVLRRCASLFMVLGLIAVAGGGAGGGRRGVLRGHAGHWVHGLYGRYTGFPKGLVGPMAEPGRVSRRVDHCNVLRTLEDMYGLPPLGLASRAHPLHAWTT